MRTIKFPVVVSMTPARKCPKCTEEIEPEQPAVKVGDILATCLNAGPNEGLTVIELAERLPLVYKLKAANSHIKLEEAEWKELENGVRRTKWTVPVQSSLASDIYAICKAALDAQEDTVEEAPNRAARWEKGK